jgi:two-component system sensor histidine kinase CpxA
MFPLFWKIFLTFWLTILTVELFTAWITADLSEYEIHPILEKQNEEFVASSTQAVSVLTAQGLPALHDWLQQENNLQAIDEIFVVNRHGEEINNKSLPDSVKALLDNDYTKQTLINHSQPVKHLLTFRTTTPEGEEYLLVSTFEHPPLVKYLLAPQRVTFGILISGLICFLLAQYFTSPLARLRRSTQMLSLGAFDTTALQQLRKRNDEFGALAIDFDNMSERLRDLLDTQRQLLRDISHELRSPLARISVALGLARNKYSTHGSDEIDRIEREIERLEFLIQELLTFVKIEPHNKHTPLTRVDIRELLEEVVHDARYEQQQIRSSHNIILYCPHDIDVKADARLLHRAIENIVRNACYYSPRDAAINVHCWLDSDNVHISIEDEGPGVPQNMLEKIFQPFVRVSSAREADTGGTGIGLAIAKRVIDMHNGKITATNKPDGNGLIVTVILPALNPLTARAVA